ncbi:MAG TPA: glutamine-hydrolyzing GMP synthase [Patescibacteria group bacterium]|nr:glutamine-hydrolyzing GMP synthase [Patescibacteria group bacterium]
MEDQKLIILDYGSQYTQLIARRARELNVFSQILPYNTPIKKLQQMNPLGVILSGGPASVYDKKAPTLDPAIFELEVPILGICYGLQLIAMSMGGKVEPSPSREYGKATLHLGQKSRIIASDFDDSTVWMSHGDHVAEPPEGFIVTAKSDDIICGIEDPELMIFGLQFHPEVVHSQYGMQMLENFIDLCGFNRDWTAESIIEQQIEHIRKTVGDKNVVCALSGGVDSSIAATLVDRAIGKQQTCIFVDNGLLRQDEYRQVLDVYQAMGLQVKPIRAAKQFLSLLKGVTDPEQKRKIIGAEFINIFEREAKEIPNVEFLVQGTLYPDVIESISVNGPSAVIKSHHNVGGLPEKMKLKLIEPLREVFKDEVRAIGKELGLPEAIVNRQAFPGPGLGVRIVGEITHEAVKLLQQADAIVRQEIEQNPAIRKQLYQYFAILLPIKSVGVMGDGRTYERVAVVKAFHSEDVMTAEWAYLPHELLARISNRIVGEVQGINRVVYDITSKPPGTIEWE